MSPNIVVANQYITLQFLPDKNIVYHIVHKPVPDQVFKDILNAGTELIQRHKATKWLSDDRLNGPVSAEFTEWALSEWGPRTISMGWKYWANIVPLEVQAAGSLMPAIEAYYEIGLRMMVFSDLTSAVNWLDDMGS